ncbi:methyl-accepting chemotaxis protein [Marinobacterium arenosum]|uniref:methyl-accepting chemotaxis protein n=1 Tax=Marinobacterium arenosum TaxID=2862496 RepID=UPI001C957CA1|nr:HAMP domain-containing methyl-accepting chemotaxis protein [Marinobacterium arenosum]MBY4678189.1 MCP four helix bundle domain-containing protein [Marinobacterium arenosum]
MRLSVSQRIGGGFGLLCLLLLLVGAIAWYSFQTIDRQLRLVTREATPRVEQSGQLLTELLQTKYLLRSYLAASDEQNFSALEQQLEQRRLQFSRLMTQIRQLSERQPSLQQSLTQIEQQTRQLFSSAEQLFQQHRSYWQSSDRMAAARPTYDETVEELLYTLEDTVAVQVDFTLIDNARFIHNRLSYVANLLEQLLEQQDLAQSRQRWQQIEQQLAPVADKLAEIEQLSAESHAEIDEYWQPYQAQLHAPDQLIQSHLQALNAKQRAQQYLSEVESLVNDSEQLLQAFIGNARQQASQAEQTTEATINRASMLIALGSLIALLAAAAIAWLLVRRIRRSLGLVMDGLHSVAEGRLDVSLAADGQDEFGRLAGSVNHLAGNLRQLVSQIRQAAQELQQTASRSEQLSQQTQTGVASQSLQSARVAATMNELEASATEVAQHAEQTLQQAIAADGAVTDGHQLMERNRQAMRSLSEQVSGSTEQIEQLQAFCESIGEVIDVIRAIAEQTNLLALNAAIEAARAGEQGRGFAVVADEVRSLASRTQGSTAEIEQMVAKLQTGARQSVDTMARSREQADDCLTQLQQSADGLIRISSAVEQIRQMNTQVAAATDQQRTTAGEISQSLSEINQVTERTAQGAEETARQSNSLNALARQLDELIGRFSL